MKPVLYGYQHVRIATSPAEVENGRRVLAAFAAREGFALVEVFVDADANRPLAAFAALIAAVRRNGADAIAVPSVEDLGQMPRVRRLMRERLEREAGVRVLVAQSLPSLALLQRAATRA